MPARKLFRFDGMRPAWDDRLLEDNQATYSRDCYLFSGSLIGWRQPKLVHTCAGNTAKVYRIPTTSDLTITGPSLWLEFADADTDVIRSPTVDDTFQRYYWVSPSQTPVYNTRDRIAAGNAGTNGPFLLGVPAPGCPPIVTASGGGLADASVQEARTYVYTWVTAYGEESAPSDFTIVNAFSDSTWVVGLTTPSPSDQNQGLNPTRNIQFTNIYRTIVSEAGDATYFLVAQVPVATPSFTDTEPDNVVALNTILQTATWGPPPADLQGITQMPNGMLAGFRNNEVWFCEPFYPHSWPSVYVITTEFPIVGLGAIGQSLVICTRGYPVVATGVSPGTISVATATTPRPCISRGSIVSGDTAVFYASTDGLTLVQGSSYAQNFTEGFITKEKWQQLVPQSGLRAINFLSSYFAFGSKPPTGPTPATLSPDSIDTNYLPPGSQYGFNIDFGSANLQARWLGFNTMAGPILRTYVNGELVTSDIAGMSKDHWTGLPLIVTGNKVYYYDFTDPAPTLLPFKWRSKVFMEQWPHNYEAMKIYFTLPPNTITPGPVRGVDPVQTFDPTRQLGLVRIYADGRLVNTREIRKSGELMRIKSGYKAVFWQWEIEAQVNVTGLHVATSVKELREI
jgi:hypothetical protein